ncbi:carboxylesterase/lipase family protein [Xanthocytophaga agilis]|uniref:carboxylesterase/lipase family protein n=1 Tax=Xanthocytophaga agilis TaxID=3048010 RepID=UPI0028D34DB1|nr:carboxylesterase family protein [Xanthocytophaga agilis]
MIICTKHLLYLFIFVSLVTYGQTSKLATITLKDGKISGTKNQKGYIHMFKGIPFAAPPVGNLRWKEPQPVIPWKGIRKCDTFSASAMQTKPVPFMMYTQEFLAPAEPLNEDCLYLNVWTPAKSGNEKLPVIVWIHGGAFVSGSGSVPIYDGEEIAGKGVVFVTINYRLGVLGFLAHPELTKESAHQVSGNYGLLDQIAALRWVKENIAGFGGNPNLVTIAGQSAGAFSVNALMASPLAKGLFHRVIAESGGMFNGNTAGQKLEDGEKNGLELAQKMGTASIAELRARSAEELIKAGGMFRPVIDNYVLPAIYTTFAAGKQNDVPVLTGWNAGDGFASPNPLSATAYREDAEKKYGRKTTDFLKAYPGNTDEEAKQSQFELARDQVFGWQNYTWASLQSKSGKNKTFLYYFSQVPPNKADGISYGAFHSAEISYALHTLHKWDRPWRESDRKLEDVMSSYWVNFAATGDPNGKGLPIWPAFTTDSKQVMELSDTGKVRELPSRTQFEFWDMYQTSLQR